MWDSFIRSAKRRSSATTKGQPKRTRSTSTINRFEALHPDSDATLSDSGSDSIYQEARTEVRQGATTRSMAKKSPITANSYQIDLRQGKHQQQKQAHPTTSKTIDSHPPTTTPINTLHTPATTSTNKPSNTQLNMVTQQVSKLSDTNTTTAHTIIPNNTHKNAHNNDTLAKNIQQVKDTITHIQSIKDLVLKLESNLTDKKIILLNLEIVEQKIAVIMSRDQATKDALDQVTKAINSNNAQQNFNTIKNAPTYASMAGHLQHSQSRLTPREPTRNTSQANTTRQNKTHVVHVVSKDKPESSPAETFENIKSTIAPGQFKILKYRDTRRGVLFELGEEAHAETLIEALNKNNTLNAYKPSPFKPTITIHGVPNWQTPDMVLADLAKATTGDNTEVDHLFDNNKRHTTRDMVIRVNTNTYRNIKDNGFLLGTGYQHLRVSDKVLVSQCQNCYRYDHRKNCTLPKICRTCGQVDKDHICTGARACVNCPSHAPHLPNTTHCPIYANKITQLKRRILY